MTELTAPHDEGAPEDGAPALPEADLAPGSPRAIELGCSCSVLANAAYNAGTVDEPLVDLQCRMHHLTADEAAPA